MTTGAHFRRPFPAIFSGDDFLSLFPAPISGTLLRRRFPVPISGDCFMSYFTSKVRNKDASHKDACATYDMTHSVTHRDI